MEIYRVKWSPIAVKDLGSIVRWIAKRRPGVAIEKYEQVKARCRNLDQMPERGRQVPELRNKARFLYREIIIRPWRIVYRITDSEVLIMAVFDSRRDADSFFEERGLSSDEA